MIMAKDVCAMTVQELRQECLRLRDRVNLIVEAAAKKLEEKGCAECAQAIRSLKE